ncbi:MAG: hypothetical protein IH859_00460 [Chloroflexi bacterium]|nr:hypothetical protein [Chloroflexota bacterium]
MSKRTVFTNEMIYETLRLVHSHVLEIGSYLVRSCGQISRQADTLEDIRKRLDALENNNHDDRAP